MVALATQNALGAPMCLPAVSCTIRNVPNLDGCCINDPSGHFLQTQFWDTSPALGGAKSWTIHGLWPDFCDGGFDQFCDNSRSLSPHVITQILRNASSSPREDADFPSGGTHPGLLDFIEEHWLSMNGDNAHLWAHEWNKHGTCISTLNPECYEKDGAKGDASVSDGDLLDYFTHAALLYNTLPTYDFLSRHGIFPSTTQTYELEHLQRAVRDSPHGAEAIFRCRNHNELSEVWYSFHVRAALRNGMDEWKGNHQWNTWVPTRPLEGQSGNCPSTGIRYLPKKDGEYPSPTHTQPTATGTATATPTSTSRPFTGKGRLMVKVISYDTTLTSDSDRHGELRAAPIEKDGSHEHKRTPKILATAPRTQDTTVTEPLPSKYTGCLIRKGTWYLSRSLTSCAIFTVDDDARTDARNDSPSSADDDDDYHLFTLASRFAPCSFVEDGPKDTTDSSTLGSMHFSCSPNLPFQSILSNDASINHQHTEAAKRLTLGAQHKSTFYAEKVPSKSEQVELWTDDGWGERKIKVEVYWEAL